MDTYRVELSTTAWVLFVISFVATFGIATLVLWWVIWTKYPHLVDGEGVTTRDGTRYRWADVEEALTIRRRSGQRGLRLSFEGGGRVLLVPNMIVSPEHVFELVEKAGIKSSSWR